MRVVTHSEISSLFRCPRSHELSYIRRLTPKRPVEFLTESIACHDALEIFYGGGAVEDALRRYDQIFDDAKEKLGQDYRDTHEVRFQRMRALIVAYFDHYGEEDRRNWDFEEVEYEFELPIVNPANPHEELSGVKFCGKIDGIWREKEGRRIQHLVEHKFLSQFDVDRNTLSIDQQVSLYSLAAFMTFGIGYPITLYNVSKKPVNKMKANEEPQEFYERVLKSISEKPEKYFHRTRLCRSPRILNHARELLWVGANMIVNGEPRYKYRNVGMHCTYLCRFIDICMGDNPVMEEAMFDVRRKTHQELAVKE